MPSAPVAAVRVLPSDAHFARLKGYSARILLICLIFILHSAKAQYSIQPGKDLALSAFSGSVFAGSLYLQHKVKPLLVSDLSQFKPDMVNRFDRIACYNWNPGIARASDLLGVAAGLSFVYFPLNKSVRQDVPVIAYVAFQSFMLSQSLSNAFKLSKRTRPYVYGNKAPLEAKLSRSARFSFFSAHTSTVSSLCYSFAYAHRTYISNGKYNTGVWAAAAILPAVQGYLRVKAGKHFPSDVIVGYITGLGTAYLMHRMHLRGR